MKKKKPSAATAETKRDQRNVNKLPAKGQKKNEQQFSKDDDDEDDDNLDDEQIHQEDR